VADSFEKGAELLKETSGIRLGESTVQRTTEATGERIAGHLQKGRTFGGKAAAWDWFQDACGQTVGYIEIDATGVRQQGPGGVGADGRMAYVGMIANPLPDRERVFAGLPKPGVSMRARYVSGLYPLAEMGPLLRRQGAQVGLDRADAWVAITDGGAGLEDFVRANFARVEAVILDFYHAAEYLEKLARALHPRDESAATEQTTAWSRLLRDEGGEVTIAVLENREWPGVRGLAAVRAEVLGYSRNRFLPARFVDEKISSVEHQSHALLRQRLLTVAGGVDGQPCPAELREVGLSVGRGLPAGRRDEENERAGERRESCHSGAPCGLGVGADATVRRPSRPRPTRSLPGRYPVAAGVPARKSQYRIVLISNGFRSGFSDRMRAAIPARCGVAQLVAGSRANGPR
jgi:hypothetical protein